MTVFNVLRLALRDAGLDVRFDEKRGFVFFKDDPEEALNDFVYREFEEAAVWACGYLDCLRANRKEVGEQFKQLRWFAKQSVREAVARKDREIKLEDVF